MRQTAIIKGTRGQIFEVDNAFSPSCWFEVISESVRACKGEWAVVHTFATTSSFVHRWAEWNIAQHFELLGFSTEFKNLRPMRRVVNLMLWLSRLTVHWSDDSGVQVSMPLLVPMARYELRVGEGWGYTFQSTLADPVEGAISIWAGRRKPLPLLFALG
jgi:hypothetical protein